MPVDGPRAASPIGRQLRALPQAWRTQRWAALGTIATDGAWLALVVFSAATLLTHNTAVFFVLATNLFVLGLLLYQRLRKGERPLPCRLPHWRTG
ncbi:MAG: hypothetical protein U0X20_21540 [Caldilineaceae bacterium]